MSIKVSINGFGRIGRSVLRTIADNHDKHPGIEIVSINDLNDTRKIVELFMHDSLGGNFKGTIKHNRDSIFINSKKVMIHHEKDISKIPWKEEGAEVVLESDYFNRTKGQALLAKGVKTVIMLKPFVTKQKDMIVLQSEGSNIPHLKELMRLVCHTNGRDDQKYEKLMCEVRDGRLKSYDEIYVRFYKYGAIQAYRLIGNMNDALDISQNVMVKILTKAGSFREGHGFHAWYRRINRNECINFIKKRTAEDNKIKKVIIAQFMKYGKDDIVDYLTSREIRRILLEIYEKELSPEERLILQDPKRLKFIGKNEAAELGISSSRYTVLRREINRKVQFGFIARGINPRY